MPDLPTDSPANFPPLKEPPPNNLPLQLTSFVGRASVLVEVKRLLSSTRLLTLTGTGGIGKTRLALQVAEDVLEHFCDGVWLVELAPLSDAALVQKVVAAVLEVREEPERPIVTTLTNFLRTKQVLLVLDNCEHLIGASAQLADKLLRSCPHLKILATSREVLGIGGEVGWLVPSLSLPDLKHLPEPERLPEYEAVCLFIERAEVVQPGFLLTPRNAFAVAQICHRLDGIPLAIELAAARIRMFSVEQIVARLDERFHLLTGGSRTALPRHQTLRAAIDWSYDLLSESEQTLFLRLSVFVGGWTLEAVEAVCAGEKIQVAETLDLLTQLVHKSLVVAEEHEGEVRYRMLETIRQYASEKLVESGELETLRRRHCTWSVKFAEEMEPRLRGQKPGPWLDKLEQGYENIRAAMSWLLGWEEIEMALRLGNALWWFSAVRGHLNEVRQWLEKGLAKSEEVAVPVRAKALTSAGWQAYVQKDLVRAEELLHEGVALYKMLGDKQNTGTALYRLGLVTWARSNYTAANGLAEESLALFNEIEGKWGIANSLLLLSYISIDLKEYDRARSLAEEAVNLFREIGDKWTIAYSLTDLADVVLLQGDAEATYMLVKESLALSMELDFRGMIAVSLEQLAAVATLREQPEVAARLWGAAEALREINAIPLYLQGVVLANYQRMVAAVRNQLGNEAFTSTWAEGRTMTPEQAIVMQERATKAVEMVTPVDEQLVPPSSPAPPSGNLAGLTTREIEVLRLVAMGLTDIQVAEKLVLSPRTISTHLRSIYSKLGVTSRSAATRFAFENHIV